MMSCLATRCGLSNEAVTMNNYLSQEEKQMMADLAHLLAENDMKGGRKN